MTRTRLLARFSADEGEEMDAGRGSDFRVWNDRITAKACSYTSTRGVKRREDSYLLVNRTEG